MKSRFLPLLLVGVAAFGLGHIVHSQESSVVGSMNLATFRVALDQIGQGRFASAQLLLENSVNNGGSAPENALLLAYLQEKSGENEKARTTLEKIDSPSSLQLAYLSRLGGEAQPAPVVLTATKKPNNAARLGSNDQKMLQLEKFMLTLVNAERTKKSLRALVWNDDVAAIARAHSAEMRDKDYFAHESPVKSLEKPIDRYQAAQKTMPRLIAENIYRAWGDGDFRNEKTVREGHDSLMKSTGHRKNILSADATQGGIGIVANKAGHIWITQVFVRP